MLPELQIEIGVGKAARSPVLSLYLAPWRDPARRKAAVIAPRQLIRATAYLREVEAGLPTLADRPALIVWGMADFAFREQQRQRFERAFPNHKTIKYPDASHFLQEDVGERIAEEIKVFLGDLQAT